MDCCQLEEHIAQRGVKREETGGNDPENGSPDGDKGGNDICFSIVTNLIFFFF